MPHEHSIIEPPAPADPLPSLAVLVAAQHPSIRSALFKLLSRDAAFAPVTAAGDLVAAVRLLRAASPDIVLVDRAIVGAAGLRRVPMLRAAAPQALVLIVGMGDHPGYGKAARAAGAAGYLRLDQAPERLAAALQASGSARQS